MKAIPTYFKAEEILKDGLEKISKIPTTESNIHVTEKIDKIYMAVWDIIKILTYKA